MDLNRYNQMALHRRELLELHSEHPATVQYMITNVYRPGPDGPPPPLTAEELTAYLAAALGLEGEGALTMARASGRDATPRNSATSAGSPAHWARPDAAKTTLAVIDELRSNLPQPKNPGQTAPRGGTLAAPRLKKAPGRLLDRPAHHLRPGPRPG